MKNQVEKNLLYVQELLSQGGVTEAMETYLHDYVILQEANSELKQGKEHCLAFEQDFIDNQLAEFIDYKVGNYAVNGNHSYYNAVLTLKMKDGSTMVS